MLDRLIGELKRGGPERLLEKSYPAVPPELRETVFANAVDIVLTDGTVEQDERDFIDDLQVKLEIPEKRAKVIVQVMEQKGHPTYGTKGGGTKAGNKREEQKGHPT